MSRRLVVALTVAVAFSGGVVAPASAAQLSGAVVAAPVKPAPVKPTPTPVKPTPVKPTPVKPTPVKPKPAPVKPKPAPVKPKPAPAPVRTTLRQGARGAAVLALQKRLAELGYWVGTPDSQYGHTTSQAVMALQKVAGLGRDGVTGPATWKALDRGVRPKPRSTKGRVLEVDLKRQVMVFAVDGRIRYVVNTSTGAPATPTPRGDYRIYRQQDGWRTAPLGKLYRPKYFHRGYAVHGVNNGFIPGYPASHGCTRVSMAVMDMMWGRSGLRNGDRVWIY